MHLEPQSSELFDAMPDAMVGVDATGSIVLVNPRCEQLFGYTTEELLGQSLEILVPDGVRPAHADLRQGYLANPTTRPMAAGLELEGRRSDGSTFPAEISLSALHGEATFVVMAAVRDISERVEAELSLRFAVHAADVAEAANAAKDEFLSMVSHELRTPLNAVIGFAQLLEREPLTAAQHDHVDHIRKAGGHLLDLINDLLDISRIASGRIALSAEPVAVTEIINDTAALIAPLASTLNIRVATENANGLHVLADRQRLKQVLLNLLSNAIKYNVVDGRVDVAWSKGGPNRLRISVTDTGHGMSPEMMLRLFSPFDRLEADLTQVEGVGLGLALSKALVEAMGGELTATSELGVGSTFTVDLPLTEPQLQRFEREAAEESEREQNLEPHVILYIEDNLSNVRLMEQVLALRRGLQLMPAMQGRLGIDLALQHRPDLILLDLHLPDVEGEAVLAELRAEVATRDIPVVIMSADATPGRIRRLMDNGATAYITKPIVVDEFLDLIGDMLHLDRP